MAQFPKYLRHVVFLETGMVCPPETRVTADAGTDFVVGHRDDFYIVMFLGTLCKCTRQQISIPTPAHAANQN